MLLSSNFSLTCQSSIDKKLKLIYSEIDISESEQEAKGPRVSRVDVGAGASDGKVRERLDQLGARHALSAMRDGDAITSRGDKLPLGKNKSERGTITTTLTRTDTGEPELLIEQRGRKTGGVVSSRREQLEPGSIKRIPEGRLGLREAVIRREE
jgi:hypothetical protein